MGKPNKNNQKSVFRVEIKVFAILHKPKKLWMEYWQHEQKYVNVMKEMNNELWKVEKKLEKSLVMINEEMKKSKIPRFLLKQQQQLILSKLNVSLNGVFVLIKNEKDVWTINLSFVLIPNSCTFQRLILLNNFL